MISDVTSDGGVSTHMRDLCSMAGSRKYDVSVLLDQIESVDRTATALGQYLFGCSEHPFTLDITSLFQ